MTLICAQFMHIYHVVCFIHIFAQRNLGMFFIELLYPLIAPSLPLCPHQWMEYMIVPICRWMGWVSVKCFYMTNIELISVWLITVTSSGCQWNPGEEQSHNHKHYRKSGGPVGCISWKHGSHKLREGNQWFQGCTFF